MSEPLSRELLQKAFKAIKDDSDRLVREQANRAREVQQRGPYRSALGRMVDAMYIQSGPLIVSPPVRDILLRRIEEDEANAPVG